MARNIDISIDTIDIENNDMSNISNFSQIFDIFANLESTQVFIIEFFFI